MGKYGHVDYMFNNAGIAMTGEVQEISQANWDKIISINFVGAVNGSTEIYKHMIEQKSGHIINTSSAAGLFPEPIAAAYSATKHAILGFLRAEAIDHKIKVSAVCPGYIDRL